MPHHTELGGRRTQVFSISKGAPHVIVALCQNKDQIQGEVDAKVLELGQKGIRSLAVAKMYE
eukprot:3193072-Rhodomonas_salina.1